MALAIAIVIIGGGTYQLPTTEAEGSLIKRKCAAEPNAHNLCANIEVFFFPTLFAVERQKIL